MPITTFSKTNFLDIDYQILQLNSSTAFFIELIFTDNHLFLTT